MICDKELHELRGIFYQDILKGIFRLDSMHLGVDRSLVRDSFQDKTGGKYGIVRVRYQKCTKYRLDEEIIFHLYLTLEFKYESADYILVFDEVIRLPDFTLGGKKYNYLVDIGAAYEVVDE